MTRRTLLRQAREWAGFAGFVGTIAAALKAVDVVVLWLR